ncbi:MAG: hypothetical protein FRX49_07331 [Trebouxia sp. A1-2]|nr:MAG: hypothetical protein FRX49_07331 [Trebouxia sp. A1-2]
MGAWGHQGDLGMGQDLAALHLHLAIAQPELPAGFKASIEIAPRSSRTAEGEPGNGHDQGHDGPQDEGSATDTAEQQQRGGGGAHAYKEDAQTNRMCSGSTIWCSSSTLDPDGTPGSWYGGGGGQKHTRQAQVGPARASRGEAGGRRGARELYFGAAWRGALGDALAPLPEIYAGLFGRGLFTGGSAALLSCGRPKPPPG